MSNEPSYASTSIGGIRSNMQPSFPSRPSTTKSSGVLQRYYDPHPVSNKVLTISSAPTGQRDTFNMILAAAREQCRRDFSIVPCDFQYDDVPSPPTSPGKRDPVFQDADGSPKQLGPVDPNAPCIDIGSTKRCDYSVMNLAAKRLQWQLAHGSGGLVIWVSTREDMTERLRRLRPGEWLSSLPGIGRCCSKEVLANALEVVKAPFWPRTWYAGDMNLEELSGSTFDEKASVFIVKPVMGTQGKGISLVQSREELEAALTRLQTQEAVVQEYIAQPLLLQGFKWDARIYVLVLPTGQDFTCFLAREGLARVCPEPYEQPTQRNLHRTTMHLTNYSLSRMSEKYVHNNDPGDASYGCKRTLSVVLQSLETTAPHLGISADSVWDSLKSLARVAVNAMMETIREAAAEQIANAGDTDAANTVRDGLRRCFHVIGLDVLLDDTGKPWLLEINACPSFSLEEARPLDGVRSVADVNQLFMEASRDRREKQKSREKWGRPCRCAKLPRPHIHCQSLVDAAVKLPVVEGALKIVQRAAEGNVSDWQSLAEGTIYIAA